MDSYMLKEDTHLQIIKHIANSQFIFFFCSKQEHNWLKVKVLVPYSLIHVLLSVTPKTVACQVPLSMECSRQEYWSGLPFPSPGDLPNPGIEPGSPTLQIDSLPS